MYVRVDSHGSLVNGDHQIAHSYQYSFEPNKHWSGFYATSEEIRNYIGGVAEKYGANRFVQLRHKVTSCVWDDTIKQW